MQEQKMVCIYRTPNMSEIAVIKSLLEDNKIPYFIENEHFALRGSADGAINFGVMVQENQADEVKEFLKEIIEPGPYDESKSLKAEIMRKYRAKHINTYFFLDIFGLLFGITCLAFACFMILGIFSSEQLPDKIFAIVMSFLLAGFGLFIIHSVIKDMKSLLEMKAKGH